MDILLNNLDFFISILVFVAVFFMSFFVVPFAQKKGWLSQDAINSTQKALEIAQLIASNMNLGSAAGKTNTILQSTKAAVSFVEKTMKLENNEDKKDNAMEISIKFLEQEGIEVTDEMKKLIEVGIESAVSILPKTNN